MKIKRSRKAFTIVELVIVIAVIAILATVLVPAFGEVVQNAKDSAAKQEAKNAYTDYLVEHNGVAAEFMVYEADGRFVALHNGAAIGVYDRKDDALKTMVANGDLTLLADAGNGLWMYGGVAEPNNPPVDPSTKPVWNADLNHIIFYGQSFSNGSDAPYYADSTVDGVYVYGKIDDSRNGTGLVALNNASIQSQHPVISTGNVLAQMLSKAGCSTNLILGSYGAGGQSIAQLMSAERRAEIKTAEGYTYDCDTANRYSVFEDSVKAIANYANSTEQSVKCPVIVFLQGERDYYTDAEGNFHAYAAGGDKDTYKLYMTRLKEDMQKEVMEAYGQSEKPLFVIYQVSGSYVRNNSEINMAQIEFAQENADVVLTQTPYFTSQYTTSGHLTQNGYRWMGEYIAKSAYAAMVEGQKTWPMLYSNMECVADNKVSITVSGAVGGLSIDTYTVENATNTKNLYGFNLIVNGNVVKPTAVTVSGNEILITVPDGTKLLSANSITVQYAGSSASGTGNIRDNCTDLGYYKYLDDSADKGTSGDKTISHSSLDASGNSIVGKNYPMYNWLASFSIVVKEGESPKDEPDITTPANTAPVLVETISDTYVKKGTCDWIGASQHRIEKYAVTPGSYVNIKGFLATAATCAWVKADGIRVDVEAPDDITFEHGGSSNNDVTVQVPEWAVYIEVSIHKSYTTTITGVDNNGN